MVGGNREMSVEADYVIGLDYGTNSCRAVLMQVGRSEDLASTVFLYPSGTEGIILDPTQPHLARQNPDDYLLGFSTRHPAPSFSFA